MKCTTRHATAHVSSMVQLNFPNECYEVIQEKQRYSASQHQIWVCAWLQVPAALQWVKETWVPTEEEARWAPGPF
jgi:hypothetical protein